MSPQATVLPHAAQALKQCQNCLKSETDEKRLLSCSKCKRAHYCDRECQTANWKSHKPICNINREMKERIKADSSAPSPTEASVNAALSESTFKKWIQIYRPLLTVTAVHALRLKTNPDRILTHMLVIDLTPSPSFIANPKATAPKDAFRVVSTSIMPLSEMKDVPRTDFAIGIENALENSRQVRANGSALGYAVVMTTVASSSLIRLTPLGIEGILPEVTWNKDWEATLEEHVRRGETL